MAKPIPDSYEISTCFGLTDDGVRELRAAMPATDAPGFDGYISTWWTVDDRGTAFAPGAFKKTIKERSKTAPILWNHDFYDGVPIGAHADVREDDTGVLIRAKINEGIQRGAEVMSNLRFGVPTGLSFGFDRLADRTATKEDPIDFSVAPDFVRSLPRAEIRVITEVRHWESSPVTFPANPKAKPAAVRSLDPDALTDLMDAIREGRLDESRCALVEQIVAAWSERAAAGEGHGTRPDQARHRKHIALDSLMDGLESLGVAA